MNSLKSMLTLLGLLVVSHVLELVGVAILAGIFIVLPGLFVWLPDLLDGPFLFVGLLAAIILVRIFAISYLVLLVIRSLKPAWLSKKAILLAAILYTVFTVAYAALRLIGDSYVAGNFSFALVLSLFSSVTLQGPITLVIALLLSWLQGIRKS